MLIRLHYLEHIHDEDGQPESLLVNADQVTSIAPTSITKADGERIALSAVRFADGSLIYVIESLIAIEKMVSVERQILRDDYR